MRAKVSAALSAVLLVASAALAQDKPHPAKAEQGESVYSNYCQTCHGDNLVSNGQTFDLRRLEPKDRARFQNSVEKGKGQMPPWKGVVSEDEIDAVWHFIMSRRS